MKPIRRAPYFLTLCLFGLIAVLHLIRLRGLEMNPDETWHIWQTFGTPEQILAWTPYDWTPLYPLLLGGWRLLVGQHPFMLHLLSLFFSLIGSAFAFQSGRKLGGLWAGWFTLLIYGGLSYSAFLSGYIRPYALAHALIPLGFYLTLRCFETPRLRATPAFALTLTLIASFYTTLVAPIWIACFGFYTLIVYPLRRTILRWLPIAAVFIAASIPILLTRATVAARRATVAERPPFFGGISAIGSEYGGDVALIWLALALIGAAAWLFSGRRRARPVIGLLLWSIGGLIAMYLLHPVLGFFMPSYSFWTLTAFTLLGGLLLTSLPRPAQIGGLAILIALVFVPVPARTELNYALPGVSIFSWLHDHVRGGDVVALDPGFDCFKPYELDYYTRTFFPAGLPVIQAPPPEVTTTRRVWYAVNVNTQDTGYAAALTAQRIPSIFVGPPTCLFRLYEAPPDPVGTLFANGMRLHGTDMIVPAADQWIPLSTPPVAHEGETIMVRLWWSADTPLPADFSVGLYLLDEEGEVVTHVDSAPAVDPPETSRWQTDTLYVEDRALPLPFPLLAGNYTVAITVYDWRDNTRFAAPGADANHLLTAFTLSVMSWSGQILHDQLSAR
ncbi:MAG: hypothetical protein U0670_11205 [Anaerolineae bacterium]